MSNHSGKRAGSSRPRVGVTPDLEHAPSGRLVATCAVAYLDAVYAAGAEPVVLAPIPEHAAAYAERLDGFVFTGGNDPLMEDFGRVMHAAAKPVHPRRQRFELALLDALSNRAPQRPVLGVCLGMQYMSLHAGGDLDQHLPESLPTHESHRNALHSLAISHAAAA